MWQDSDMELWEVVSMLSDLAIWAPFRKSSNWYLVSFYWSHVGWHSRGDWDDCSEQRILSQLSDATKMCSLLWQDLWRECESRPLNPHPRLTAGVHTKLLFWEIMLSFLSVFFRPSPPHMAYWLVLTRTLPKKPVSWSFLSASLPLPLIAAYRVILFQIYPDNKLFSTVWLSDLYVSSSMVFQCPQCIVPFI